MNEDVQYESGTSSVQVRMCSKCLADHQFWHRVYCYKIFQMTESLVLLIYQVQIVSSLWEAKKIN